MGIRYLCDGNVPKISTFICPPKKLSPQFEHNFPYITLHNICPTVWQFYHHAIRNNSEQIDNTFSVLFLSSKIFLSTIIILNKRRGKRIVITVRTYARTNTVIIIIIRAVISLSCTFSKKFPAFSRHTFFYYCFSAIFNDIKLEGRIKETK